jgi:hypothetical protein
MLQCLLHIMLQYDLIRLNDEVNSNIETL